MFQTKLFWFFLIERYFLVGLAKQHLLRLRLTAFVDFNKPDNIWQYISTYNEIKTAWKDSQS